MAGAGSSCPGQALGRLTLGVRRAVNALLAHGRFDPCPSHVEDEHVARWDVSSDARPTFLAESVMRLTCITCGNVWSSSPFRFGEGGQARMELLQLWDSHCG